ncbi:hypothetical protein BABINDRAFT_17574, partial [Babjeviella inositovora NRRL Y-12698]
QQFHRKSIGDWDFIKTIGAGSMGKVKLAKHVRTGDVCAVKIVPRAAKLYQRAHQHDLPPLDKAEAAKRTKEYQKEVARDKRTIREGALGRLLYHPFICRLYEMIPMTNHYYMLFEYVQGGQMLDYIVSHGSLKERHARKFARGIASALDYCHRNSVVHRDLKIENIMIAKSGDIKLIDFGLSNMFDKHNLLKTYCGSLYFAAPELLSAHPYIGPEVDVWSFGVVLYVLVCGKVPFDDPSVSALHEKIKRGKVDYPDHLSRECLALLSRMLVVKPDQRATLAEVMSHPWMVKGFDGAPASYMPLRFPISLPLDQQIVRDMVNLDMGTEELIAGDLAEILSSSEYKASYDNWYAYYNANAKYRDVSYVHPDSGVIIPDPTNAYHPLISIYYLVEEMRKRKRAKEDAVRAEEKPAEDPKPEPVAVEKPEPVAEKPHVTLPTFPEPAYAAAPPLSKYQTLVPGPAPPAMAPPQQQPSRTLSTRKSYDSAASAEPPTTPSKAQGFNLFRRFSAKKPKEVSPGYDLPPLPNIEFDMDGQTAKGAGVTDMTLDPIRRGVSMKVTSRERKHDNDLGEKYLQPRANHTRTASAAAPTAPASAPVATPISGVHYEDDHDNDDFVVSGNYAPPQKLTTKRKMHPTARAKSVGHMRADTKFDPPPLPTHLDPKQYGALTNGKDGSFFDDVTLDSRETPEKSALPSIATLTHQSHLTDRQVIEQAARAPSGSMPSIEFPRTLFLKGFFSVQTTSTKPLPVIRYDIVSVLSKLGVTFTEVKGGFVCMHTPSIEANPVPEEEPIYENALTSKSSENDTAIGLGDEDEGSKTHRRKFSLGTTLLSYRRKTDSGANLQEPAPELANQIRKARSPLKFEIHLVKVPLVGLYGVQFKKVLGNTWMYKALAGQILGELNL